MKQKIRINSVSRNPGQRLLDISAENLMEIPYFESKFQDQSKIFLDRHDNQYDYSLDGISALALPKPANKEEEVQLIQRFLDGLSKLLSQQNNWMFLGPLELSLKYCERCQTCSQACPVFIGSGKQEIYRPTFRSEILRRIKTKYMDRNGRLIAKLTGNDIELNWTTIARLAELSYRCTICRRCAQVCPMGVDNGLIAREIRKIFSQEMGIAPPELHEHGTMKQLETGSSTGMNPKGFKNSIDFMEDEIEEKMGRRIKIPIDKKNADILFIHNAGEYLSWPENPEAIAVIFDSAGLDWTISSELFGYDAVNYGTWYDDIQLGRLALKQVQTAKSLGAKRIVIGECGHAHKALMVLADRVLGNEFNIPCESSIPLLEEIVSSGKLNLKPFKNNFPVTLHDPCNIVRLTGIVEPQRKILRAICPQFREMNPNGLYNYCCGGGSGFVLIGSRGFPEWRVGIAGRMKVKQILESFSNVIDKEVNKYVCAPCSNCKAQLTGLAEFYTLEEKYHIFHTGLAELVANAMDEAVESWVPGHVR